jgi:DNA-binding CsgD family transcriptional regulator
MSPAGFPSALPPGPPPGASLSPRERQVLRELASGATYDMIAHRMQLSRHTVDTYLRRIRTKTGSQARVDLLLLALTLAGEDSPIAVGAEEQPAP